jgi:hypothetical protein
MNKHIPTGEGHNPIRGEHTHTRGGSGFAGTHSGIFGNAADLLRAAKWKTESVDEVNFSPSRFFVWGGMPFKGNSGLQGRNFQSRRWLATQGLKFSNTN